MFQQPHALFYSYVCDNQREIKRSMRLRRYYVTLSNNQEITTLITLACFTAKSFGGLLITKILMRCKKNCKQQNEKSHEIRTTIIISKCVYAYVCIKMSVWNEIKVN